jgi:hypothetical protein
MIVAKLKGARDRARRAQGKCEGRKAYAEREGGQELVAMARQLRGNPSGRRHTRDDVNLPSWPAIPRTSPRRAARAASGVAAMPSVRRFPPPWTAEETDACFIVRDASGQALAYVYF